MASVINQKTQQELEAAKAAQPVSSAASVATPAAANAAAAPAAPATNLKGLSENTTNKLNQYSQGYQQSASVQAAQNYLNGVLNQKPVADAQLSQLYDQVMNRGQFNYDLNGDALYQQYKDRFQNMGKQAMMDTMGNATALTGGYGSSYATTAGNQAYQQHLQQLNDIVPDLYKMAYDRYNQEGADLMNRYNMAYGLHRDAVGDWQSERDFANSDYWNKYNADYTDYQNQLAYWNQMAQQENAAYYTDRDYAYSLAMAHIQSGSMPSEYLLTMAGIPWSTAKALLSKKKGSGGGGGSSKKSSSGGGGGDSNGSAGEGLTYAELVSYKNNSNTRESMTGNANYSSSTMEKLISASEKAGTITGSQASTLRKNASNRR